MPNLIPKGLKYYQQYNTKKLGKSENVVEIIHFNKQLITDFYF